MSLNLTLYAEADTGAEEKVRAYVLDLNVTHNLTPMWHCAKCYEALYKSAGKHAKEIVADLQYAIGAMEGAPEEFRKLNPVNGWGQFDGEHGALEFLKRALDACEKHPLAIIGVSA